ncbi:DUF1059 domain-containing protein [Undibacterium terreum]|uniref:DUF1059 domain-containing protein n=1 Tax=Undibacterium terreum TaxID=1224302 RepID=A0A916UAN1_9BURK|nr:DUF1059 domain-containing protein [Undibacterium terreum]GGC66047.1 hypothetical protein GCM10011396_11290 [Undibacterium terreum]
MTRKYIDCREFPSEMHCTVTIAADSEAELIEVAVQHAVAVHHHTDGPELRQGLRQIIRDGTPSETYMPDAGAEARGPEIRPH